MYLECSGDDFTGSSGLGETLEKIQKGAVQYSDVPNGVCQRLHSGEKCYGSDHFGHSFRKNLPVWPTGLKRSFPSDQVR